MNDNDHVLPFEAELDLNYTDVFFSILGAITLERKNVGLCGRGRVEGVRTPIVSRLLSLNCVLCVESKKLKSHHQPDQRAAAETPSEVFRFCNGDVL